MEKYEYTTRDYSPLNRAINNEVDKQSVLNRLTNAQARVQVVIAIAVAAIAIALLVLLGVLIYKAWQYEVGDWQKETTPVTAVENVQGMTKEQNSQVVKNLEKISRDETPDPLITTRFTVFQATVTDTGEEVVTGLTYDPTDFENPVEQYCYLEGDELGGEPLANVDDDFNVIPMSDDPYYIGIIDQYCLFKLPPLK